MFIRKIFSVMLLMAMLILPQSVSAEKTDWSDKNFNFRSIRNVIVFDMTVNPNLNYGGQSGLRDLQDTFVQNASKLRCNVITEAQARQTIGWQIGRNLDQLFYSNPMQARQIIMQNAYRIADAWVIGNVDSIDNTSYVEPARTVWEQKEEKYKYRDHNGRIHEETRYVKVPVNYPPRRVEVSGIQMSLQVYNARGGKVIFSRKDVRDRQEYQKQQGMFGRITKSFFEDLGKKIR